MTSLVQNFAHRLGLSGPGSSNNVAHNSLPDRKESQLDKKGVMTTESGAPVAEYIKPLTAGPGGPILLQDHYLLEKMQHLNRERIPERVVHAHGFGAHGYFQVTHDISKYCKADVFKPNQKTNVFVRFSPVRGGTDSTEANRDIRGFSIKHYTNEGVWDMVGNNTPVFFIRNPVQFVDLVHVVKRDPKTNLVNFDAFYDWIASVPESIHQALWLMGPRGLPAGYQYLQGYSSHTFKFVNAEQEEFYVKMHYHSNQKVKNLKQEEAEDLKDPYFATRDFVKTLDNGGSASWTMKIQVIPKKEAQNYKWNIFDLTKVIPHSDYPLIEVGQLVLNQQVTNYFAETEQVCFSPSHLVPGIEPSCDPILQSRLMSYHDAHMYRVGVNQSQLPINCPFNQVRNNDSDGRMCMFVKSGANYYPNTQDQQSNYFNGHPDKKYSATSVDLPQQTGTGDRFDYNHPNSDFEQPNLLWNKVFSDEDRKQTVSNFATTLVGTRQTTKQRMYDLLAKVDEKLSQQVQKATEKLAKEREQLH